MQLFAQGLVGLRDLFIHPNYVSGATMNNIAEEGPLVILILLSLLWAWWAWAYYLRHRKRRTKLSKGLTRETMVRWRPLS